MLRRYPRFIRFLVLFYLVWLCVGLTLLLTTGVPQRLIWSGGVYLVLAAILSIYGYRATSDREYRNSSLVMVLLVGVLGWGVECLGVHTGFPFGSYTYRAGLGPRILGVPITISGAWISVEIMGWGLWLSIRKAALRIVAGALTVTAMDFLIDPVASGPMNDWIWQSHGRYFGIPWGNFFAWFGLSLFFQFVLSSQREREQTKQKEEIARLLYVSFVGLFGLVAVRHLLFLPVLIGLVPAVAALSTQSILRSRNSTLARGEPTL